MKFCYQIYFSIVFGVVVAHFVSCDRFSTSFLGHLIWFMFCFIKLQRRGFDIGWSKTF